MGENSFLKIVKDCCCTEGISGSGNNNGVKMHGLRGTLATLQLEAGISDSSVAMRTGRRDHRSLKICQHLQVEEVL